MSEEKMQFQAEVGKILDIVVNALYSDTDIFLRELVSNASDACDKLRYAAIMKPDIAKGDGEFRIDITPDKDAHTLTIADNGIGMNKQDLIKDLGSIGRSGSAEFLNNLTGDKQKDATIIGQFGVGFYSAFMVAEKSKYVPAKPAKKKAGCGRQRAKDPLRSPKKKTFPAARKSRFI